MTRQILDLGTNANDGTGDTLRSGGTKINDNFLEIYKILGDSSRSSTSGVVLDSNGINYIEGAYTVQLNFVVDSNATVTLPHKDGKVPVVEGTGASAILDLADSANGTGAKILFGNKYDSAGVLPSATVYHGMFAHVHSTERAVFAHGTEWINLIDSDVLSSKDAPYSIDMKPGANQTNFTNLRLTTPYITSEVLDSNGNEILGLTSTGVPANYVEISANAASDPKVAAVGDSDNVGIEITAKGSGSICLNKTAYKPQTMEEDGAISDSASLIILNKTTALAASLDSGTEAGEYKILINKSSADATITPIAFNQGTSFTLKTGGSTQVIWDGSTWFLIGSKDSADADISVT